MQGISFLSKLTDPYIRSFIPLSPVHLTLRPSYVPPCWFSVWLLGLSFKDFFFFFFIESIFRIHLVFQLSLILDIVIYYIDSISDNNNRNIYYVS